MTHINIGHFLFYSQIKEKKNFLKEKIIKISLKKDVQTNEILAKVISYRGYNINITSTSRVQKNPNFALVIGKLDFYGTSDYIDFLLFKLIKKEEFDLNFISIFVNIKPKNKLIIFEHPINYFVHNGFVFLHNHQGNFMDFSNLLKRVIKSNSSFVFQYLTIRCVVCDDSLFSLYKLIKKFLPNVLLNSDIIDVNEILLEPNAVKLLPISALALKFVLKTNTIPIKNLKELSELNMIIINIIRKIFRRYRKNVLHMTRYEKSITQYFTGSHTGTSIQPIFHFLMKSRDAGKRKTRRFKRRYTKRLKKKLEKRV